MKKILKEETFYTKTKKMVKDFWYFLWSDDSMYSFIVNIVLALFIIRFLLFPSLNLVMGTSYPMVVVVSGSMDHNFNAFDTWWEAKQKEYVQYNITETKFQEFTLKNGFRRGDIIVLIGLKPEKLKVGDIIVYQRQNINYPIIHRIVQIEKVGENYYFHLKGDANGGEDPSVVTEYQIEGMGRAIFKIPFLGYIKIFLYNAFFLLFGQSI